MASRPVRPAAPTTNWNVVLSASQPHHDARTEFAVRYAPVIRRYLAGRWRIPSDAPRIDDALQDVFVECFKHGGALERVLPGGDGGFRAYLFAVTRNVAREFERQRRCDPLLDADARPDHGQDRPSVTFDRSWAREIAREAMREFGSTSRRPEERLQFETVRLRFQQELLPREIAARLDGLTARRVSKLIETGMRRYEECLYRVLQRRNPAASRYDLAQTCRGVLQAL